MADKNRMFRDRLDLTFR